MKTSVGQVSWTLLGTAVSCSLVFFVLTLSLWAFADSLIAKAAPPASPELTPAAQKLLDQREQRDETVWKSEVDAQAYERVFLSMWDELRAKDHSLEVLKSVVLNRINIPVPGSTRSLEWGINEVSYVTTAEGDSPDNWLTKAEFSELIGKFEAAGFKLQESEWHHSEFQPAEGTKPAESLVSFLLHVLGPNERMAIKGKLKVLWAIDSSPEAPEIDSIRVKDLKSWTREGPAAFEPLAVDPAGESRPAHAQPLMVYDLDGDGRSEIVLGESNVVYRNRGGGKFNKEQFLKRPVGNLVSGILADFDRDGRAEYVCIGRDYYLSRSVADQKGNFTQKAIRACDVKFDRPQVFSAGDVDGDGDLDLWVGQYMPPFVMGQMPIPYYDANDGFPDYLLINDGKGNFTDGTQQAQLTEKANRRTYAGSLVDLNGDQHLDLLVICDFSGVDVYYNDGTGKFTDVTADIVPERHTFGMGHSLADYDLNGKLDLYVVGMSSTTARRLSKLGLGLDEYKDLQDMRPVMGYGNRIYLSTDDKQYKIPEFNDQVARTGWSWGCSSFDFDNDGDRDIYVANGHRSGESCQDYCTTFWRHDIYLEPAGFDQDISKLLGVTTKDLDVGKISWNGYEHNKLLMNRGGSEFVDIAWVLGIAFESDSRAVVSDDLDGDGRVDLLFTEYKTRDNRESYRLKVLMNRMDTKNQWIGVRLQDSVEGGSTIGALVTATAGAQQHIGRVVTGDSFTAQHAPVIHFGLGDAEQVDSLQITWADGRSVTIDDPKINQYHDLSTAEGK